MSEVVLSLPLERSRKLSPYHPLFLMVSNGEEWEIDRSEFGSTTLARFQGYVRDWASHRNLRARTKRTSNGNLLVQMFKQE